MSIYIYDRSRTRLQCYLPSAGDSPSERPVRVYTQAAPAVYCEMTEVRSAHRATFKNGRSASFPPLSFFLALSRSRSLAYS